jgi:hypothetical protein
MSSRTIAWVIGLCLAGCRASGSNLDAVGIDPAAESDLGPLDVIGQFGLGVPFKHTLAAGKTTVVTLPADTLAPFDVTVDAGPGVDADLQLELWGPFDPKTGLFNPMRARSVLVPGHQTHILGFVPPQTGKYFAMIRDAQLRMVPVTVNYAPARAAAFRFNVTGNQLQAEADADGQIMWSGWVQACLNWKQQMLQLSGNNVEQVDCGTPTIGPHGAWMTSNPTMTVAVPGASFDHVDTSSFGDQITASSLDDLDAQCDTQLTAAKAQFADRLLAATCKSINPDSTAVLVGPVQTYQPTTYLVPAP